MESPDFWPPLVFNADWWITEHVIILWVLAAVIVGMLQGICRTLEIDSPGIRGLYRSLPLFAAVSIVAWLYFATD